MLRCLHACALLMAGPCLLSRAGRTRPMASRRPTPACGPPRYDHHGWPSCCHAQMLAVRRPGLTHPALLLCGTGWSCAAPCAACWWSSRLWPSWSPGPSSDERPLPGHVPMGTATATTAGAAAAATAGGVEELRSAAGLGLICWFVCVWGCMGEAGLVGEADAEGHQRRSERAGAGTVAGRQGAPCRPARIPPWTLRRWVARKTRATGKGGRARGP